KCSQPFGKNPYRKKLTKSSSVYIYDALGRRIEKHQIDRAGKACNRTHFLWDGLRMIQETRTNIG
ncbi:MAG: hypothetical protein ACRCR8_08490, partial [Snodgrassella alvi]